MLCPKCSGFRLHNIYTHETIVLSCRTYGCPVCGPKKINRLRYYLRQKISSWNHIRLFTFTMTNRYHNTPEEHYKTLCLVWRYFITYVRRTLALSKRQRNFSYVKCPDLHKSGYIHFHAFFSEYMPRTVLNEIWEQACQKILSCDTHAGNVHAEGIYNARVAANYVTKYITKSLELAPFLLYRYSKSKDVKLFPAKKHSEGWLILLPDSKISSCYFDAPLYSNLLSLESCHKISEVNQQIESLKLEFMANYTPP
jgi:hypothetical protein